MDFWVIIFDPVTVTETAPVSTSGLVAVSKLDCCFNSLGICFGDSSSNVPDTVGDKFAFVKRDSY